MFNLPIKDFKAVSLTAKKKNAFKMSPLAARTAPQPLCSPNVAQIRSVIVEHVYTCTAQEQSHSEAGCYRRGTSKTHSTALSTVINDSESRVGAFERALESREPPIKPKTAASGSIAAKAKVNELLEAFSGISVSSFSSSKAKRRDSDKWQ